MKIYFAFIVIIISVNLYAQKTTYSKYEENMVMYANNGLAYATKYDSVEIAQIYLDSCWNFIHNYPNSFAKPNVLNYMLQMTALITSEKSKVYPLVDSVLTYDTLGSTRLIIGELLIERKIDELLGRDIIVNALPYLTTELQRFLAYKKLAHVNASLGHYSSAKNYYEKMLEINPDEVTTLYEYLALAKMGEFPETTKKLTSRIQQLEINKKQTYKKESISTANINKNISEIEMYDLDSAVVQLKELRGKITIINRFNFWCGFCIKEFPALQKIMKKYPEIEFVFVNSGESSQELKELYLKKPEFSFLSKQRVLFATSQYFNLIYGNSVPHTMVVDKQGNIRFDYIGYNDNLEELLISNIEKLLQEQ